MQEKDIKRSVIKQLKTKFPYWRRLTKKQKEALVEEALPDIKKGKAVKDFIKWAITDGQVH